MKFDTNMIPLAIAVFLATPASALSVEEKGMTKLRGGRNLDSSSNYCNTYDAGGGDNGNFGTYWNTDGNPPCSCEADSAYPSLLELEFSIGVDNTVAIEQGGGYFGYLCTTGNCNNYDGSGFYSYGIYHNTDGNAPCGCGDPAYPYLVEREYTVSNSTRFGYVCAATSPPPTPAPTPATTPQPTSQGNQQSTPPPTPQPTSQTALPNCNTYGVESNGYSASFGSYFNKDSSNPPCGCGDPSYPNFVTIEYSVNSDGTFNEIEQGGGNFGYLCTSGQCPTTDNNSSCHLEEFGNCECSSGEYTVKQEEYFTGSGCYRCAKP